MRLKKSIMITLFLCLLMIGSVSASENATNDISSSDVTDDSISQTDDNKVSQVYNEIDNKVASSNNEPIKEEYKETSFKALNKTINDAKEGSTIELKQDYIYDENSDSDFEDGITISKSITINGKGKTIDANSKARIFKVTSGVNLILKNLILTNGKADDGGVIYAENKCNLTMTNSQFTNNIALQDGGSIFVEDNSHLKIINTTFTNNTARVYDTKGGAIYTGKNCDLTISTCAFTNNKAYTGGAIYITDSSEVIIIGGVYKRYSSNVTITGSQFTHNTATYSGGAIFANIRNMNIINTTFTKNTATILRGGAVYGIGANIKIEDNTFTHNTANGDYGEGGAIFLYSYIKWVEGHNKTESEIHYDYIAGQLVGQHIVNRTYWVESHYEDEYGYTIPFGNDFKINNNVFKSNTANDNGETIQYYGTNTIINNNINSTTSIYSSTIEVTGTNLTITNNKFDKGTNTPKQPENQNNNAGTNTGNENTNPNTGTTVGTNPTNTPSNTLSNEQTIKITAPTKTTYKAKTKTKKYTVTLKNKNKPIKKATIKLTIKGKKYTVKTNNKGKATFKIKNLKKKGKYTATITYKGIKRTVKIIVK